MGLVGDGDLPLASAALRLMTTLTRTQPGVAGVVADKALPAALALVRSPLLQGVALVTLQGFLAGLVASGAAAASFESLLGQLLGVGTAAGREAGGRTAQHSVAQCVAALCRCVWLPLALCDKRGW